MKIKELIKLLLDCPMDNEARFLAMPENEGYNIDSINTSKVTNITWISDERVNNDEMQKL